MWHYSFMQPTHPSMFNLFVVWNTIVPSLMQVLPIFPPYLCFLLSFSFGVSISVSFPIWYVWESFYNIFLYTFFLRSLRDLNCYIIYSCLQFYFSLLFEFLSSSPKLQAQSSDHMVDSFTWMVHRYLQYSVLIMNSSLHFLIDH